jgi:hypothetical protein
MLKRPDGWKLEQKLLDTVWGPDGMNTLFGRMMLVYLASGRDDTSSGRMEQWTDERPDGMARRPDGWNSGQMSVRTGCLDRPDG